jgi:HEAT repeat protein
MWSLAVMNFRILVCGAGLTIVLFVDPVLSQNEKPQAAPRQPAAPQDDQKTPDVTELAVQLRRPDLEGRLKALDGLRELGPQAAPATAALIQTLDDVRMDPYSHRRVSDEVAAVLKGIGQSAVDLVVEKIKATKSPSEYHSYALAIHNFGTDADEAAEFLIAQLATAEGTKTELTMHALNTLGEAAVPAMPHCVKALYSDSFHTRSMACDTLGALAKWKRPPDQALKRILELLSGGVGSTRGHAALCLGRIGVVDGFGIVDALVEATQDRQDAIRDDALRALGQIGPAAEAALPWVQGRMADPNYPNRVHAARTAWLISRDAKGSVTVLQQLMKNPDKNLDAIDTLAEMKSAASAATPQLTAVVLDSPDPDLRMQAVRAIGLIGSADESVRSVVKKAQNDSDPDVAKAAERALKRLNKSNGDN